MLPSPSAGQLLPPKLRLDVARLLAAYFTRPDISVPQQRVRFGTSGHRGSAFSGTYNEAHILALAQATCDYRLLHGIDGPVFVGFDTHVFPRRER